MALGRPDGKRWRRLDRTSNCKRDTGRSYRRIIYPRTLPKPVLRGICVRMQYRTWKSIWIVLGETLSIKRISRRTARTHGSTPHPSQYQQDPPKNVRARGSSLGLPRSSEESLPLTPLSYSIKVPSFRYPDNYTSSLSRAVFHDGLCPREGTPG